MKQFTTLLALTFAVILPVYGGDLVTAFNAGKVCERVDGYIQATPGNESETEVLVASVNAKRAKIYADIAADTKNGVDPTVVGVELAREEKLKNPGRFCS
jgi:uncharacterized protein YdbL (DUF1318 family)